MIIRTYPVGMIETNCYILIDEKSGEAAVIDPGYASEKLKEALKAPEIKKVKYILLTHGHFDHVLGVYDIQQLTGAQTAIHKNEVKCLSDERASLAGEVAPGLQKSVKCDIELREGMHLKLGELDIEVIFTPGHTSGGCCFKVGNVLFSGDTLFCGSVGRCDLPGGNYEKLIESVKKIDNLFKGEDLRVLSGHGEETTLNAERRYNPYMRY